MAHTFYQEGDAVYVTVLAGEMNDGRFFPSVALMNMPVPYHQEADAFVKANKKAEVVAEDTFKANVERLVKLAQAKQDNYWNQMGYTHAMPDLIVAQEKRKFVKLIHVARYGPNHPLAGEPSGGQSSYCWVRKEDGAILKGDWKAPDVTPGRIRGYISDSDEKINSVITEHGVVYLR